MNAVERQRFKEIQHEATRHVQRYAKSCDKANDDELPAKLANLRSYVAGLRDGLTLMGMSPTAAHELARKAGYDFTLRSYTLYRTTSIFDKKEPGSAETQQRAGADDQRAGGGDTRAFDEARRGGAGTGQGQ